jgi:hypothetical protein
MCSSKIDILSNFAEYFEVVGQALEATDPACPGVITEAMDELLLLVEQGDSANITELFKYTISFTTVYYFINIW